uniref:Uncharacterized protein n=1 Tax=Arundo donax TaxID=35708 RepID=A0A0A9GAP7_ARUDO
MESILATCDTGVHVVVVIICVHILFQWLAH